jgi:hypothetical protein
MAEGQETGLGPASATAIRRKELHRALEIGFSNRRILRLDLLIGLMFDAVARHSH